MRISLAAFMSAGAIALIGAPSSSQAQTALPPDRSVLFEIHADTGDPGSPVLLTTEIRLTAKNRIANEVAWNPIWVAITHYDGNGAIAGSWFESNPHLQTSDRFWHVSHADAAKPETAEFVNPPELSGVADSDSPNGPTLDYFIKGRSPTGSPNSPYPITSILDYSFWKSNEPEPVDDGEDEPVDIPEGTDDPT